jgi:hypothetical protein
MALSSKPATDSIWTSWKLVHSACQRIVHSYSWRLCDLVRNMTSCKCTSVKYDKQTCRKATGSLKIVHEKYGEKMKSNQDETEAYYNEFRTAKAVNEAMEGHIQKVRPRCRRLFSFLRRLSTMAPNRTANTPHTCDDNDMYHLLQHLALHINIQQRTGSRGQYIWRCKSTYKNASCSQGQCIWRCRWRTT